IKGLESLNKRCIVEVHSDSAYVVNAINNDWLRKWASRKWENVKNPDLWRKLASLLSCHDVRFIKVKGHADDEMNNRCDEIARKESQARGE
ncbi:MAG: ribonuclease HI, partial [Clostridia bacterium]|nr:ribonuclease HI [Clostridia bacterium]